MPDRGYQEFQNEDGSTFQWKRCEVPGCPNMICRRLSAIWCWPHTMSGGAPVTTSTMSTKPDGRIVPPKVPPPDTLTLELLQQMDREFRKLLEPHPAIFAPPPAMRALLDVPPERSETMREVLFGPRIGSYIGLRVWPTPPQMFRPPEKPFRSRPRRTYVRAHWVPIRAARVTLRAERTPKSWRHWKGRKVPNRTGYPQNSVFVVNPNAILNMWPVT